MKHRDANGKLSLSLDAPLKDDSGNDISLGELLPENTLSVEEKVEESIRHQTIIEALENLLIPQQKKVILKRYFEGVPVGEVAEEMKIHSVTVHKIKRKAFDTIRKSPYAAALQNSSD
jgi:RNA polymerase sigma factor (sigma-70 family)